jgi:hypothetical protein
MNTPQNITMWWSKQLMISKKSGQTFTYAICSVLQLDDIRSCVERPLYCDALRQLGCERWMWRSMQAIVFVEKVFWLVSLAQIRSKKSEIAAPPAVCDVVSAATPKLKFRACYAEIRYA